MARKRRQLRREGEAKPLEGDTLISGNNSALHIMAYPVLGVVALGAGGGGLLALAVMNIGAALFGALVAGVCCVILVEHFRRQAYRLVLCDDCMQYVRFGSTVAGQIPLDNIENVFVAANDGRDAVAGDQGTDVVAIKLVDRRAADTWWISLAWRRKKKVDLIIYSMDNLHAAKMCKQIWNAVREYRADFGRRPARDDRDRDDEDDRDDRRRPPRRGGRERE